MTLLAVIGDEVSYWRDESSAQPDVETYRAVLPSLVASGGMWVGISTGYRRAGLLFQKHRDHFGRDGDDVLVVSGPTEVFNPTIDPALIAKARAEDPEARRRNGTAAFAVTLRRFCPTTTSTLRLIMTGRWSWGRVPGCATRALLIRPAAVTTPTAWPSAISRVRRPTGGLCLTWCVVRSRRLIRRRRRVPLPSCCRNTRLSRSPATLMLRNGSRPRFATPASGIERSEKPKAALYLEAQTLFARGGISLPDHAVLLRELRLLERRTHRSGKDTVDHGLRGHDDYANAVLGCAARAMRGGGRYRYPANMDWVRGPPVPTTKPPSRNFCGSAWQPTFCDMEDNGDGERTRKLDATDDDEIVADGCSPVGASLFDGRDAARDRLRRARSPATFCPRSRCSPRAASYRGPRCNDLPTLVRKVNADDKRQAAELIELDGGDLRREPLEGVARISVPACRL